MVVEDVSLNTYHIPLREPWGDTTHSITHIDLLLADIRTDNGATGTGFTYSVGVGIKAVEALLRWDVIPQLVGARANPRAVWHKMWQHLHDTGGGGTSTLALAAVDTALWDIVAKAQASPLVAVLGQVRPSIPAYGSGVNLHLSQTELEAQVQRWLDREYRAVKVKVGYPDLKDDLDRLAAVRSWIGPHRHLMVDANQAWDVPTAIERIRAYEPYGLHWLEEPLISDDVEGHEILARRTSTPIAIGENIYTKYQVASYLRRGACDYLQADVIRVGGITPWLDIAAIAEAANIPLAPHFILELTGQLLCCVPNAHVLEDVEGGSFSDLGILRTPLPVEHGSFTPPSAPGHGIDFDRDVLEQYQWPT